MKYFLLTALFFSAPLAQATSVGEIAGTLGYSAAPPGWTAPLPPRHLPGDYLPQPRLPKQTHGPHRARR